MTFRDLLSKHSIADISVLSEDTRDFIKEYTSIEKSKLPTIRKDGILTDAAVKKMSRLNKVICDGIIEYVTEIEDAQQAEADRIKAEQDAETARLEEEQRIAQEAEQSRIAIEETPRKKIVFGVCGL